MSTQTHSLLKKHYCPDHAINIIASRAAEYHIDLNTVKIMLDVPLCIGIGEPNCGHVLFVMSGIYGRALRVYLADAEGNLIKDLDDIIL